MDFNDLKKMKFKEIRDMNKKDLGKIIGKEAGKRVIDRAGRVVLGPLNALIDENVTEVATSVGAFIIKKISGKFVRTITFMIGVSYVDRWMEEALYGILYEYNDIKKKSNNLELGNANGERDGSGMYYRLAPGSHGLKYRDYDIILVIEENNPVSPSGRTISQRKYTLMSYNLDPNFITDFEKDMILHRNSLLKIKADSPTVNVYTDAHENDGYTYWDKGQSIHKRRLGTVYLDRETKHKVINTVNNFFASRDYYIKHGVTWKLNILLHGVPGVGKDTIAKMIASEWNRNIYYVTGGKNGMFIPNAISDTNDDVNYPLFIISDIDKYPFLINDTNVELDSADNKEEKVKYKQQFGAMINALDGITSGDGRIVIMTTNHIEKFSPTFLRPGRIDLSLEIKPVTSSVFRKYVYDFYGEILPENIKLKNDKVTPADLQFDVVFLKLTSEEFIKKHVK